MRCPVDNETLVMADRGGVEIDYCPKCRGVWLDRGELDKIIDKAQGGDAPARPVSAAPPVYQQPPTEAAPPPRRDEGRGYRDDDDDDQRYRGGRKRRESFLGELFDF